MRCASAALLGTVLLAAAAGAQELSMAEIEARIRKLEPVAADHRFVPPAGWRAILGARVAFGVALVSPCRERGAR